jgi:hypothetical protein
VRKHVSAPGTSVVIGPPCAWEIAGETMWQPVPDFPLAFDPSGRGLRWPDAQQSAAGIAVRTRRRSCGRGPGVQCQGSRTWVRRRAAAILIRTGRVVRPIVRRGRRLGARLGIGFNGLDLILRAQ